MADPPCHPRPALLHAALVDLAGRRPLALRCRLHGALLHHVFDLESRAAGSKSKSRGRKSRRTRGFSLFFIVFHGFFHDFSTHLARIDRFYYLFGFLSLVLVIVLITCAEISIALTYFQLTSEVDSSRFEAFRAASGPFRVLRRCIAAFEGAFRMVNPRSRGLQMVVDLLLSQ